LVVALFGAGSAQAASLQPIGGFESPTYVTSDPGNPNRLFVVERSGRVKLVENGTISVFAELHSVVGCCNGDSGLYSIALAPDFDTSGRFYLAYSGNEPEPKLHVAEMQAIGNTAPLSTLRDVLPPLEHHGTSNYGGQLQFGPEGDLFISTGDGDSADGNDEPEHNAQRVESPFGKILRIKPEPTASPPYTVPADNPYVLTPGAYTPVWSLGLKDPFRFSFDRGGAGMLIGDVGENRREEIDLGGAPGLGRGVNYGWNCFEGALPGEKAAADPSCTAPASAFTAPIFEYSHGPGCAVIGGYVVHDPTLGAAVGRYLYGDLCTGEIRSFELANPAGTDRSEGLTVGGLVSFGEDSCGRIYTVSANGVVSRLVGTVTSACVPPPAPHAASTIGIKALRRKVRRHKRATISAFVSPCNGRKGEAVKLFSGRRHVATAHLSLACTVRFRPRIAHAQTFRAEIAEDATYVTATSRTLHIAIDHSKPKKHKKGKDKSP
jgi:glucose/arabinose dehydrogenase